MRQRWQDRLSFLIKSTKKVLQPPKFGAVEPSKEKRIEQTKKNLVGATGIFWR